MVLLPNNTMNDYLASTEVKNCIEYKDYHTTCPPRKGNYINYKACKKMFQQILFPL